MQIAFKICPDISQVVAVLSSHNSWSLAKGHPIPDASDSLHLLWSRMKANISSSPIQASEENHRCKLLEAKCTKARAWAHKNRYQRGLVQSSKNFCYMWLSQDEKLHSVSWGISPSSFDSQGFSLKQSLWSSV